MAASYRPMGWEIEDLKELNTTRFEHLDSIGAVHPRLVCSTADALEAQQNPHVACFFQLPYPISLEPVWHRIRYRPHLYADIAVKVSRIGVVWRNGLRTKFEPDEQSDSDGLPVSHVAALVPVSGRREQYYDAYLSRLNTKSQNQNPVIVPLEMSWVEGRAMTVADYEESLCRRLYEDMHSVLRRLLPSYSVLSLQESPLSPVLSGFYVMPAPGRLIYSRLPEPIIVKLLKDNIAAPARPVTSADLQKAMTGPRRQISQFEHQLFAMNRLHKDGEAALALIGTLSLIEWFVNSRLEVPKPASRPGYQPSLSYVLKTETLGFLPNSLRDLLIKAIEVRDKLVHGSPPIRASLTLPGARPGRDHSPAAFHVQVLIEAAFELYKTINYEVARQRREVSGDFDLAGTPPSDADSAL